MNVASYIIANDGGIFSKYAFGQMKAIPSADERRTLNLMFGAQLVLNFLWTPIFFKYKRMGVAFVDIISVLGCVVWLHVNYKKYNTFASKLMIPYIAWVSYASYLNLYNWINNRGTKSD